MRRLIICIVFAGCTGDAAYEPAARGPFVLDDALLYVDDVAPAAVIVDPGGHAGLQGDQELVRIALPSAPSAVRSVADPDRPGKRRVVMLDPAGEQLLIISGKTGLLEVVAVGLPFDALDVSPDGRFGLAYQPEDQGPSKSLFAFPNAVAVIDFLARPVTAVALRLPSAGARPRAAAFARSAELQQTITIAGTPTAVRAQVPVALVFVAGGLVPIDLQNVAAGPSIPLGSPDAPVSPAEVLFTDNRGDALRGYLDGIERAFVRSEDGELFVLSLTVGPPQDPSRPSLFVTLENVVTPDTTVDDVELFFAPDGRELLLAAAQHEVLLVDGYTGVAARFEQETFVDTLAAFDDPVSGRRLALGYGTAQRAPVMLRLDPLGLDQRRATGVETLRFSTPIASVHIAAEAQRAVLYYDDQSTLGVLDLVAHGEVLDVRMAGPPEAEAMAPSGNRLWLVSVAPTDDASHLAAVELGSTLATSDVRLDAPASAVGEVGDRVWVDHADASGSVTFFPKHGLERGKAIAFHDVLFAHAFDRSAQ